MRVQRFGVPKAPRLYKVRRPRRGHREGIMRDARRGGGAGGAGRGSAVHTHTHTLTHTHTHTHRVRGQRFGVGYREGVIRDARRGAVAGAVAHWCRWGGVRVVLSAISCRGD